MAVTESIEGVTSRGLWFHYDIGRDVLYLRLLTSRDVTTVSEETEDGVLLLRREDTDEAVGLTAVSWWKRFGEGELPTSYQEVSDRVERWAPKQIAA